MMTILAFVLSLLPASVRQKKVCFNAVHWAADIEITVAAGNRRILTVAGQGWTGDWCIVVHGDGGLRLVETKSDDACSFSNWDDVGVLYVNAPSCPPDWEIDDAFRDTYNAPDGGVTFNHEWGYYRFTWLDALLRYIQLPMSAVGVQRVYDTVQPAGEGWVAY